MLPSSASSPSGRASSASTLLSSPHSPCRPGDAPLASYDLPQVPAGATRQQRRVPALRNRLRALAREDRGRPAGPRASLRAPSRRRGEAALFRVAAGAALRGTGDRPSRSLRRPGAPRGLPLPLGLAVSPLVGGRQLCRQLLPPPREPPLPRGGARDLLPLRRFPSHPGRHPRAAPRSGGLPGRLPFLY